MESVDEIEKLLVDTAEQQTAITSEIRATIKTVIEEADEELELLERLVKREQELIAMLPVDRQQKWRDQGYGFPAESATSIDQVYELVKHC